MNTSEKTDMIAAALSGVHKDLANPRKDSKANVRMKQGGTYSYQYLSLPALIDHAKKALDSHGVAVMQDVRGGSGFVEVSTVLMHLAGQYVEFGPLFLPAAGDAQQYGSAITYARRYALAAALNLAADEDDDGRKASAPSQAAPAATDAESLGGHGSASQGAVPPEPGDGEAPGYDPGGAAQLDGDELASPLQWQRLSELCEGNATRMTNRLRKATGSNKSKAEYQREATKGQLAAAIAGAVA